jgi:hypothetical protein
MVEEFNAFVERIMSWLLLPATLLGACGGMLAAVNGGKSWPQVIIKTVSGAIVAHICGPVIAEYVPQAWVYAATFLAGWGGLELAGKAYSMMLFVAGIMIRRATGTQNDSNKGL